jgi:hypothetical protein
MRKLRQLLFLAAATAAVRAVLPAAAWALPPIGHFVGVFERFEGGGLAKYEVDLILRRDGERTFAVQFERGLGKAAGKEMGMLLGIEELGDGSMAFRKVYVDGKAPVPRMVDVPTLIGRSQNRPMRGRSGSGMADPDRPSPIVITAEGRNGFPGYSYVARPAYRKQAWVDYDAAQGYFGRARAPFEGELTGTPGFDSLTFTLRTTDPAHALPCGVAGASLELVPLAGGLYAARLNKPDLERDLGLALDRSLFGFVIPVSASNFAEGYREMRIITFQAEGCASEIASGSGVSTRVIVFDNKDFF